MNSWIQYHNCENMKRYPSGLSLDVAVEKINIPEIEKNYGGIFTRKRKAANDSIGNQIFLIIGVGKPKKYYLWSKILADKVNQEKNGFFTVSGNCKFPQNPISLNLLTDFDDFKHYCGNFGLGLQNITNHPFSKTLDSLLDIDIIENEDETLDDLVQNISNSTNLIQEINDKMKGIHPDKVNRIIESTIRKDSKIVALIKEQKNYTCQFPGCKTKIPKKNGGFYIEVAHIKPVSKGGQSIIGNLLVLCPNHHKAIDYGEFSIVEQSEHILRGTLNRQEFEIKI